MPEKVEPMGKLHEISSVTCPYQWLKSFAEEHGTRIKGLALVTLFEDDTAVTNWVGATPGWTPVWMVRRLNVDIDDSVLRGLAQVIEEKAGA